MHALLLRLTAAAVFFLHLTVQAGTAIVIGGATKSDNDAVWQRVVDEAGGPGARIAVFATAAANPERSAGLIVASLNRRGANAEAIPVAPRQKDVDWQANLNDPALIAKVAASKGVFFSGGAQEYIVDTLQPGGEPTAMLKAIRQVFDNGGVVAGTSAGAAIMSRIMFRDAPDNMQILKGQWRDKREYDQGLGFVNSGLFVDQHFLKRGRIGRMLPAMRALGYTQGLGIEENSAAVIKDHEVEIIGARGALLVDLSEASSDARLPAFNVRGAVISYLDRGDKHDLKTGVTTPAAHKLRDQKLDPASADYRPFLQFDHYFLDILADNTIVTAMSQLLDGRSPEVRGLAYRVRPRPGDLSPELGFEFRLYKGLGTMGWFSNALGSDDYTVLKVRLDVTPVRMAAPLFTPVQPASESAAPAVAPARPG
ncbi:cyanophycinase [Roseateles asaccharophilus]|uniref:Cyanophycinase n=1 Tax=Roseateles asaccharophilus TaxID=582607 RepID=A0ABU2A7V8_9BURK|nr:cyanophycinase [Roseateles asaccharophilus]MDR7333284.1 cyanophycinase [Roseateles asaccharophilus]